MGASMAGLLAARVLSEHFERVTLVERDALTTAPHIRKGVPQSDHIHILLARGYRTLARLVPGFRASVLARGGIVGDARERVRYYQHGYWPEFRAELEIVFLSRPALEAIVRRAVVALPAVRLIERTSAEGLALTPDGASASGVRLRSLDGGGTEVLPADLIVDATGRGARTPRWLEALGYPAPVETTVTPDVAYATQLYRRHVPNQAAKAYYSVPVAPGLTRGAVVMPIEDERWIATHVGYPGAQLPDDTPAFVEAARSLPTPDIHTILATSEALSDVRNYHFASSRRRRYERLRRFPRGFVVMGDAVSSFNPAYGQGMTVAAMQAEALDAWLRGGDAEPLAYFGRIARIVDVPWQLAAGADFAFPARPATRPPGPTCRTPTAHVCTALPRTIPSWRAPSSRWRT